MQNQNDTQQEIDVVHLLKKLWLRKFAIIFTALTFAFIALAASIFLLTPQYESLTKLYVVNKGTDESKISTQDLQAGDYLVKDYKEIITSKTVLAGVIEREQLDLSVSGLASKTRIDIPANTRIISITVTDENPEVASQLANAYREVASEKVKEVTNVEDVKTVEAAEPSSSSATPNLKRNTLLGFLVGGFIAVALVLVKELLDDRVHRVEDVEEVLHMTLLGIVPDTNKIK
ncbi:YveK family protein [Streptococcus hillyeri]|uniref:Capsular polysaccharide biosynthesis protein CpsC n=1 Tax=Streptococcus hillyeri TaxID=2282420 RepID=A0A3L9DTR0_9STRE|nr:Wzz/FepE/Etk N-terminal domain-containing protein [Streptococcus hillyeri]RLY02130.1 capsular biosynthesis protein CpsC [Streptococcus hillyeri]